VSDYELDSVDRQLLRLLQENARYTAIELAERVGVSDNTVHNRMERLEEAGVVRGYQADVDHGRTGLDLYFMFSCTARISDRGAVAETLLDVQGVVEVVELMTGRHNLLVKALGAKGEDITRIAEAVDGHEVEIEDENLIRSERVQAVDYEALNELSETDL
jgi:DNA-binding Lrp family transcriptional regulator